MHLKATLSILYLDKQQYHFQLELPAPVLPSSIQASYSAVRLSGVTRLDEKLRGQLKTALDAAIESLHIQVTASQNSPQHPSPSTGNRPLRELGRLLYNLLLPPIIQDALTKLPADRPLVLATDDTDLPWELLHDGGQFLALQRPVARQIVTTIPARHNQVYERLERSFLFLANPEGNLPEADKELENLADICEAAAEKEDIVPTLLARGRASRSVVMQALSSGQYDLIHYSGHAVPGALQLADGPLSAEEIGKVLGGHPLIFLNACWSAEETREANGPETIPYAGLTARSLASAFILGGAAGFIGTMWKVFDTSSREFAERFYRLLLAGKTVGEALQQTRLWMYKNHPNDPLWASFVLYGDPTLKLAGFKQRETRPMSILVGQLDNLSSIFEEVNLEDAAGLHERLLAALDLVAKRYGGQVYGPLGNLFSVRFGLPELYEDDSRRAILTAVDMIQRVRAFNQEESGLPSPLGLQVGICTGPVVVQQTSSAAGERSYQVTGKAVDLASELAFNAGLNQILVDETTRYLNRHSFVCELVETTADALEMYVVQLERQPATSRPEVALVGRADKLEQLKSWWQEVTYGQGCLVSIVGAAGVGKSRLVHAFQELLFEQEHHWLMAANQSYDRTVSYALLSQLVATLTALDGSEDERDTQNKLRAFIQQLDPQADGTIADENLALLGQVIGFQFNVPSIDMLDPELRQRRLAEVFLAAMAWLASACPVVLVLEDLQWVDEASLAILNQVVGAIDRMPVMVLAIHRPDWATNWQKQWDHYHYLGLRELGERDGKQLVAQLLGEESLPAEITTPIINRTGGNPFFIAEVVTTLEESGILAKVDDAWHFTQSLTGVLPDTVEGVILARLDRLTKSHRQTLDTAAVIGDKFESQVLAGVRRDRLPETVDQDLQDLDRRKLIYRAGGWSPNVTYAFYHGLTQQVAYDKISPRVRRTIHGLIARLLKWLYQSNEARGVERLAHHFYHSDDRVNAVIYCLKAARRAADTWANVLAVEWYDRALEKLQSFDEAPPTTDEQARGATPSQLVRWHVEALEGKSEAQSAFGHNDEAIAGYTQALTIMTDPELFPMTHQAGIYHKMNRAYENKGDYEAAQQALNAGLQAVGESVCAEGGRLRVWTGFIHYRHSRLEPALEYCQNGITMLEQLNSIQDLAQANNLLGLIQYELGHVDEAKQAYQQSIALYEASEDILGLMKAYSNLGCVYQDLSDWDEALTYFQQATELSERTGDAWWQAGTANNVGEIYRRQGELDQAVEFYQRARKIGQTFGLEQITGLTAMNLGASYLKQGQLEPAQNYLEEGQDIFERIQAEGDLPEVRRYLVELQIAKDALKQARTMAGENLKLATKTDRRIEIGHAHRMLGQVHRLEKHFELAESALEQAMIIFDELSSPYEKGQVLIEMALLRHVQFEIDDDIDSRQQAKTFCNQAIKIFEDLGATLDLEKALEIRALL